LIYRAIEVKHYVNKEKIEKIKSIFKPAKKTIAKYQWHIFFKTCHLSGLSVLGVRHGAYSLRIHTLKRF
jgi:hypothetical protein